MKKPQTWRELLKKVIDDPREKERLARSLDVNALTLTRWVNRQSTPRPDNLSKLLNALRPQHSALFRELLAAEFRDTTEKLLASEAEPLTISSTFYAQILGELADTDRSQHTWSLCQTILQHALVQFDPYHQGLILAIMTFPFIISISRESLLAVPREQREAALALGATKWESTK